MHRKSSLRTGGDTSSGWSTSKSTAPNDYRNLKRWKPPAKVRFSDRGKEGAIRSFIAVQIARIRMDKPLSSKMADSVRREVIAAGGLVAWAKRQPSLVAAAAETGSQIRVAGFASKR